MCAHVLKHYLACFCAGHCLLELQEPKMCFLRANSLNRESNCGDSTAALSCHADMRLFHTQKSYRHPHNRISNVLKRYEKKHCACEGGLLSLHEAFGVDSDEIPAGSGEKCTISKSTLRGIITCTPKFLEKVPACAQALFELVWSVHVPPRAARTETVFDFLPPFAGRKLMGTNESF